METFKPLLTLTYTHNIINDTTSRIFWIFVNSNVKLKIQMGLGLLAKVLFGVGNGEITYLGETHKKKSAVFAVLK